MEVIRAQTAGFCMGVSLALKKLESALAQKQGSRIRTIGPIIHNPHVLARFARRGVVCLNDVSEVCPGDHVLIRAHGIPRTQEELLKSLCASVADATCPRVKKAQLGIEAATARGQTLLLFGDEDHPEVTGLVSYANGPAHVFGSRAELEAITIDTGSGVVLASQTTQDRGVFDSIASELRKTCPGLVVLSTICDATRQRQEEALRIASAVELMIVIGGHSSGNTRRLAQLASGAGVRTCHVETIAGIARKELEGIRRVGLTAGASTPLELIDEAERWLASI